MKLTIRQKLVALSAVGDMFNRVYHKDAPDELKQRLVRINEFINGHWNDVNAAETFGHSSDGAVAEAFCQLLEAIVDCELLPPDPIEEAAIKKALTQQRLRRTRRRHGR
jgi:hypothetical protein